MNRSFSIVEYKTPVIKPLAVSSKELFAKRIREDKSKKIKLSKAPMFFSPSSSPQTKKVRLNPSMDTFVSNYTASPITFGYEVDAPPSSFAEGPAAFPNHGGALGEKSGEYH